MIMVGEIFWMGRIFVWIMYINGVIGQGLKAAKKPDDVPPKKYYDPVRNG
jgi:hypothetical protein